MAKSLRVLTLVLVALMVARQLRSRVRLRMPVAPLAMIPGRLLPARTFIPRRRNRPDWTAERPPFDERQPDTTPAAQRIGESQWTDAEGQ